MKATRIRNRFLFDSLFMWPILLYGLNGGSWDSLFGGIITFIGCVLFIAAAILVCMTSAFKLSVSTLSKAKKSFTIYVFLMSAAQFHVAVGIELWAYVPYLLGILIITACALHKQFSPAVEETGNG